nr:dnaJ-like protein subfamily B member 14 [Myzus persicae]
MESNRDEASRCIELTKLYIKKKDLDNAWKFSVKANKLYPSPETKRLMKKLKSSMKHSKQRPMKRNQSDDSDESYNGDNSNSSSSSDCNTKQPPKKSKMGYKSSTTYSYKMFKEINKDESFKCLEKAEEYIQSKQFELAEKFILKSIKLFPMTRADTLLKQLQEMKDTNKPDYTEEQADVVKRVKNSQNYYTMLNIKTTATIPEIKKAYKKLALLLHPDKNSAPGSGEVFIVVTNAVDTLCDYTKRKMYDQTLRKPSTSTSSHYSQSSYRHQPTFSHAGYNGNRNAYRFYQNPQTTYDSTDEGEDEYRCLDRAEYYIIEGDIEKAEKFINKSKKLFPTSEADELLKKLKTQGSRKHSTANAKPDGQNAKKRKNTPPGSPRAERANQPTYTKAQLDTVKKVNNCKDFYDVLSIKKDATDTDIKKAYKKLALVLHPDKNHAPGAAEAFKTVGNAVATLTDAEKRKRYDMVGHENSTSDHVHRNYDHGFESDITAEQLFNMFFNGAFPTRQGPMSNPYYSRSFSRRWPPETDNDNHQQQESSSIYFQLLPILLLLLLSLFSNFSYDPVYTLKHSPKYPVLRRTSFRDISYFVKDNFHTDYTGDLRRLEHTIEEDYINTVRTKCIREKEYYESLMWRARLDDDSTLFNKATKYQMKSCEEYQTLMKQKYK